MITIKTIDCIYLTSTHTSFEEILVRRANARNLLEVAAHGFAQPSCARVRVYGCGERFIGNRLITNAFVS